jgi:HK97 family phage major capsid protein
MDVKQLQEQFEKALADMRAANDARIAEVEKKGRADPLLAEKVDKANAEVGRLEKELKETLKLVHELAAKGGRPGAAAAGDTDETKAEHGKAFDAYLRKGREDRLQELGQKAVSVGDDSGGGYLVPDTLDTEIERYERDNTPMRELCRVIPVSNEHYEKLVNAGGVTSGWVDETETRTETNTPDWKSLKPYFGEVYAMPGYTQRALDDVALNLEAELAQDVGVEFAEKENEAFTVGNGVKKARGILGYTIASTADGTRPFNQVQYVASGSSGDFDGDDLIDLIHALKRGYRTGASWMFSNLGIAKVRKLKDSTTGQYLWQPGLLSGQPNTLLGYAVNENDDWPDPAADAYAVGFGNWKRAYYVIDVRGTRVIRDDVTQKGKVLFYTWKRVGGFLVNDRAVKVLKLAAS